MPVEYSSYIGMVVAKQANYFQVAINLNLQTFQHNFNFDDSSIFLCTPRKRLIHQGIFVNVGDLVTVEAIDSKLLTAVIAQVEPRKSYLQRPPVANVTHICVVLSLDKPVLDFDQANRFLLTAEKSKVKVSLALTKSDLVDTERIQDMNNRFEDWGYKSIVVSIKTGKGIEDLLDCFKKNKLSVLCGPSGVGKSSLLNHFLPNERLLIGNISGKLQRGKHTTRHVQLYPVGKDSLVADTPGFNRPELDLDASNLDSLFPEIRLQLKSKTCKFRNCFHRDEPGCSINKSWDRYSQYRKLVDQLIIHRSQVQED